MTGKSRIVESLGETGLLLAQRLDAALLANDRVKYYFTLLQAAEHHAAHPLDTPVPLRAVREACAIGDASLDDAPFQSELGADGDFEMPRGEQLRHQIFADVALMLLPLRSAADTDAHARYDHRLSRLRDGLDGAIGDRFSPVDVQRFTRAGAGDDDTVHRLVMDLHRELNRLHAILAVELVDGASVSSATDEDRRQVRAFMRGLNQTAPLKFDHPGLATTAARLRGGLSIQNDLGTTDAHVVVIRITGLVVHVTYSDVHAKRIQFFRELLAPFAVDWTATPSTTGETAQMIVGEYTAASPEALEQFLALVGSRLVFLIDWNRARKRLELFVSRREAIALLRHAAETGVGHRGFLQAGDAQLIYTALERTGSDRLRHGMRLDELLGKEATRTFLRAVLRLTSDGIARGHSIRLLEDEIQAELLFHSEVRNRDSFDAPADHAMFIFSISERVRDTIDRLSRADPEEQPATTASLAASWESRADELARQSLQQRRPRNDALRADLIGEGDDAADALEEVAFLLTLLSPPEREMAGALSSVAGIVNESVRDYVRCLECAKVIAESATRADTDDLLIAANRTIDAKHSADAAGRAVKAAVHGHVPESSPPYLLVDAVNALSRAAGALAHCAGALRDYALSPAVVRR
jgi:hypothetical protein